MVKWKLFNHQADKQFIKQNTKQKLEEFKLSNQDKYNHNTPVKFITQDLILPKHKKLSLSLLSNKKFLDNLL